MKVLLNLLHGYCGVVVLRLMEYCSLRLQKPAGRVAVVLDVEGPAGLCCGVLLDVEDTCGLVLEFWLELRCLQVLLVDVEVAGLWQQDDFD